MDIDESDADLEDELEKLLNLQPAKPAPAFEQPKPAVADAEEVELMRQLEALDLLTVNQMPPFPSLRTENPGVI